jgi:eukaryotic-like serine/threonine-protein kinase
VPPVPHLEGTGENKPPMSGAVFLGKYDVQKELGRGSFGTVWLAQHKALGRPVVIKQLHPEWALVPEARQRFEREARILASLDHPSVTRVYDLEQAGSAWYIVMEYVDGASLDERLAKGGFRVREAVPVMLGVLGGLAYIHERGVLHRDLKPGNILLTREGRPKIADFGVARTGGPGTTNLTLAGSPGTPLYMAPEQLDGAAGDARSDLYAASATFYQMLSGRHYLGDAPPQDLLELRKRARAATPKLPPSLVAPAIAAWLAKGLAKEPSERYQTAGEMAKALQRAMGP